MSYDELFKRPSRNRFAIGSDPNDVLSAHLASIGSIAPSGFTQEAENDQKTVRIDSTGIAVTGGKITVTNPGSVVIIDGTSDMFRIAATGTTTITGPTAGNTTTKNVDIATGLTYPPAFQCFLEITAATANQLPHMVWTVATGVVTQNLYAKTAVFGVDQTRLSITWTASTDQSASTFTVRYYILEQVAL